jgi:hypothetical protein
MIGRILGVVGLLLASGLVVGIAGAHYVPRPNDGFAYDETISLGNGYGDYAGYTESTVINGSVTVNSVLPNGTDSAVYYNANSYQNDLGASYRWTSSGPFSFSADSFLYVRGTDNQTGYTNPYVWFFMNASLPAGATFVLLNTAMTVAASSVNYSLHTAAGDYVKAIFAEGSGSFARNDSYGAFSATYTWKAYFDPTTGFIIGYLYTEQDSNSSGDGFTLTDSLGVTETSYPLTAASGSSSSSSSSGGTTESWATILVVVLVVVVVVVIVALLAARARRRPHLPTHSPTGQVTYVPPPVGPPPPGIRLTPSGQPAVQQIIIRETVKVNCRYCGNLIDSTVANCPFCGAART